MSRRHWLRPLSDVAWWLAWGLAPACTMLEVPPEEPLEVVEVRPGEGALVAIDQAFRVTFDGPIAPRTRVSSAYVESGGIIYGARIEADPLTRSLVIVPRLTLDPDVDWSLNLDGVRGLDGRELDAHSTRFRTGNFTADTPPAPNVDEVLAILSARCGDCHHTSDGVLGMDLTSVEGLRTTTIGVPASETRAIDPTPGPTLAGLARIEPGAPDQSFLIWKLTSEEEVPGERMPAGGEPLPLEEAEVVRAWIQAGAPLVSSGS